MSKKHYLLDAKIDTDFELLALHTTAVGFELAYVLNKNLKGHFIRTRKDLELHHTFFEHYVWEAPQRGIHCELLQNIAQHIEDQPSNSSNLFEVSITKEVYLLSEAKNVPFLLKINEGLNPDHLKNVLEQSPLISICYGIKEQKIKSKLNILNL
ncbi:MAG: IPExxxVDY family protein [Flavobacteriaceae bacterium]